MLIRGNGRGIFFSAAKEAKVPTLVINILSTYHLLSHNLK